jgi:hypothetical protein
MKESLVDRFGDGLISVEDMGHWMQTCLNRGRFEDHEILSQESFAQMWSPVIERGRPPFYEAMALGWNVGHYHGEWTISHGGYGAGWTDWLMLLPESGRALSILSLDESPSIYRIRQAVLDVLFGEQPKVDTISWAVPVCQALAEGGVEAAYARSEALRKSEKDAYWFDEEFLITPALHLMIADQPGMAIDLLSVNSQVFPDYSGSYYYLANAHLQKGERVQAERNLLKALCLDPGHKEAALLLEKIQEKDQHE